ncbi:MAG: DUF2461 domain-containing protein [Huintestinicola sp.]|uniref:DUF2461 domain-containing protein n=1 Tax=Huintestinicola sp. TaxID=2981661 RepID=UPI003EFFBE1C
MSFTPATIDFLFENSLNDSKSWFHDHRYQYETFVAKPFKEFTEALTPAVKSIDEHISHVKISRIFRDARYARGKSIFRQNMWCTFSRGRDLFKSLPAFYFEISEKGFEYGCGFYMASAETMNDMRSMILNDSPFFAAALEAFESQEVFELYGDMYKRDKFPDESPEKKNWLNRKNIGLSALSKDWELLFSDRLPEKIAEDLNSIAPVYDFFIKAEELSADR